MSYISCRNEPVRVLVTGFQPFTFRGVKTDVNASGMAVKLMKNMGQRVSLFTSEVPVCYKYVDKVVPDLWRKYKPHLTIHVGVSPTAKGFTLEKQARKHGYSYEDNNLIVPHECINPSYGPDVISTDLQVEIICDKFNCGLPENCLKAYVSEDAGSYLCEYISYTSLCQQLDEFRSTLFVHVPQFTSEETFEELARGLERIVDICVAQLIDRQHFCRKHIPTQCFRRVHHCHKHY